MKYLSEPVIRGHNDETYYTVGPTGLNPAGRPYPMAPVCFIARNGCWGVQDYFTPDEARSLAQALIDTADEAESVAACDGTTESEGADE